MKAARKLRVVRLELEQKRVHVSHCGSGCQSGTHSQLFRREYAEKDATSAGERGKYPALVTRKKPDENRKQALQSDTSKEPPKRSSDSDFTSYASGSTPQVSAANAHIRLFGAFLAEVPLDNRVVVARKSVVDEEALA
jgi:hypothetical protein